jgi:hypothetical protein
MEARMIPRDWKEAIGAIVVGLGPPGDYDAPPPASVEIDAATLADPRFDVARAIVDEVDRYICSQLRRLYFDALDGVADLLTLHARSRDETPDPLTPQLRERMFGKGYAHGDADDDPHDFGPL